MDKVVDLDTAVAHVQPGDAVHVVTNHSRWTAGARHLVRQWWGRDPGFTLVMFSLSSLGTLFFKGGLVTRWSPGTRVTSSRTSLPTPGSPTPTSGARSRWSTGRSSRSCSGWRRRPAGSPPTVTGSLAGSSMADNAGFAEVASPFGGTVGLLAPYAPDIALLHAPRGRPGGQRGLQRAGARRGVGGAGSQAGCRGHRRAGRRRHPAVVPPGADPRPPGAGRGRDSHGRPPRRPVRPGHARPHPTARTWSSGPTSQRISRTRRVRRLDRPLGARAGRPGRVSAPGWGRSASTPCGPGPIPTRGGPTRRPTRPI